ncbi:pantoate--beta-alanine ligase [Paenibacillus methanolicus]|uniref:Pantothenate synthetase n=1 Tax=Paenibacillus methanolicus TaxID=582686 RepID=A0A5S5CHN3_9BACL|nr:pantoate--beta-alanine ligase [Paenibacillus methanolicus]TYP77726.1 pantoate--beta-alanine ligase [Paenibacillus methanolicus]
MIIAETIQQLRAALRERREARLEQRIGFVPTMGFLHEGHASLMRRAKEECGYAVLSIFVNPMQFGPNEDFDRYPRDAERDIRIAEQNGIDVVFMPSVAEMYPKKPVTKILISGVTERLCGASRPGHFDGVGLVVSKLFNLVQPDRAYFGMKDAQQVAVIARMTEDLNIPVEIVPCETVREADGLALSSRNVYLSEEERGQAVILSRTLALAKEWVKSPGMTNRALSDKIKESIGQAALADIDYAEVLTYPDLEPLNDEAELSAYDGEILVALAVKFGRTRLIDNRLMELHGGGDHV